MLLPALVVPVVAASPSSARACAGLTAAGTTTEGRTEVLLSLPAALTGAPVAVADVAVAQNGLDLPVLSVTDVPPARTDVVVVVDTSRASGPVAAEVRSATNALLDGLAPRTSVAVVTTGGGPQVVSGLVRGPGAAVPLVAELAPGGGNALVDAVFAGTGLLPAAAGRQQHVVAVAAGPDSASVASWTTAEQLLARRGVALDVVDLSDGTPALPGAHCPGLIAPGSAPAAAAELARQIADRRLLTLPPVSGRGQVLVTVSTGTSAVSATMTTREVRTAPAPTSRRPAAAESSVGAGTLLLGFAVGLLGLALLLLVLLMGSPRGRHMRRALRELAVVRSGRLPGAEAALRRHAAVLDIRSALGGGPGAAEAAEQEAYDEALIRAAEAERARVAAERTAAYARAADRLERSRRHAEEMAAAERAAREATSGLDRIHPAAFLQGSDPVSLAALAEAEHAVQVQRQAAQEAMTRRAEAERLAEEAVARAERERVAAADAERRRREAEQAAAEAMELAEAELRGAGEASEARRVAEEMARVAAAEAAHQQRVAQAAVARRMVAEAQAAEAEAAEDSAVHRELAALQAAEAAEESRRAAVARLAEAPAPVAEPAPATVDLRDGARALTSRPAEPVPEQVELPVDVREAAPSFVAPAADTARRRHVVAPLWPARPHGPQGGDPGSPPPPDQPDQPTEPGQPEAFREPDDAAPDAEPAETAPAEPELVVEPDADLVEPEAEPALVVKPDVELVEPEAEATLAEPELVVEPAADLVEPGAEATLAEPEQVEPQLATLDPWLVEPELVESELVEPELVGPELVGPELVEPEAAAELVEPAPADEGDAWSTPTAQWLDAESAWADPERGAEGAGAVSSPVEPAVLESAWAASVWATDRPTAPVVPPAGTGQAAGGGLRQPAVKAGWPPAVWAWLARVVALGLVPAAVALRTLATGAWWSGLGTAGSVLLGAAVLLTLVGLRWTWVATSPPFALRRATARRLAEAEQRRRDQAVHAAELLSRLGGAGVDDGAAWEAFEQHTGLTVPGSTRAVIDPGMDPAALVRYLGARRRAGSPVSQPLLVVAVVPLVTTLVPAALLTLLA